MSEQAGAPIEASRTKTLVTQMRTEGFLTFDELVDPSLIVRARQVFIDLYSRFLTGDDHPDALTVGGRRYMVTVKISEPPFNDAQFLANPRLLPILEAILGVDCVLANYGVVCSLPGAPAQDLHRDGWGLFPDTPLDALLPPYALTVAIPLLEMNELHGTTALRPGSHRDLSLVPSTAVHTPVVREGAGLLWDYRLAHQGTANQGAVPRPLLYATYCRPWFFDNRNFSQQSPLIIDQASYTALPPASRRLLARAATHSG